MTEPSTLLLFAARLSAAEKEAVLEHDKWFVQEKRFDSLRIAIIDVCLDRLIRAEGCLELARRLATSTNEEDLRAAIGRAYYSVHHSLRAMALWKNKWDPDGHEESIRQFKKLLMDNTFCGAAGLSSEDYKKVSVARQNRHVADYSPYDRQRSSVEGDGLERITDNDWKQAAMYNIVLAEEILDASVKVVGT